MRVIIAAVGRMKAGPERVLLDRYVDRLAKQGRGLGIAGVDLREIGESRAPRADDRRVEEAAGLLAAIGEAAATIVLDETGRAMGSEAFARHLGDRIGEARDVAVLIGGADGHGEAVRIRADLLLAFGAMTWPNHIVRILAAEQLYRATTILAGHPYHRA